MNSRKIYHQQNWSLKKPPQLHSYLNNFSKTTNLSSKELRFFLPVILTFIPCFLVNFATIHNLLALYLLLGVSFVAFLSPYSGLVFLVATQIIPDISPSFPLVNADLAVIGWLTVTLMRKLFSPDKIELNIPWLEIPWVFIAWLTPFLGWMSICAIINADPFFVIIIVKAAVMAIIAWNLISQTKGRYDLCLLAILIGCLLTLPGFWGRQLGIAVYVPPELVKFMKWAGPRGAIRIGSGRGDSNTIYPYLISAPLGFLSLLLTHNSLTAENKTRQILYVLSLLSMIFCIPAALATMSRGALICAAGSLLLLVLLSMKIRLQGWPLGKKTIIMGGLLGLSLAILWTAESKLLLTCLEGLMNFWERMGLMGGREMVFSNALDVIWKFPLFGLNHFDYLFYHTHGFYTIAHNTFLDIGTGGGIPGMLFSLIFFCVPYYYLMRDQKLLSAVLATLVVYSNFLLYSQVISSLNNKVIWCLWILLIHQFTVNRRANGLPSP